MTYNYTDENQKAKDFITVISRNFTPDQAVLVDDFRNSIQHATDEHYTISSYINNGLREELEPIGKKLQELDPHLQISSPDLYHLTVYWCPIDNEIDRLTTVVRSATEKQPLSFRLYGLVAAPFGISIKAYPLHDNFVHMRELLAGVTGIPLAINPDGTYHERAVSTWITLARYRKPPTQEMIDYVNTMVNKDFGIITPKEIGVYKSMNKQLKDPVLLESIQNQR